MSEQFQKRRVRTSRMTALRFGEDIIAGAVRMSLPDADGDVVQADAVQSIPTLRGVISVIVTFRTRLALSSSRGPGWRRW